MGLGGFTLEVTATVSGGSARLEPTGQMFLIAGAVPAGEGPARWKFRVRDWGIGGAPNWRFSTDSGTERDVLSRICPEFVQELPDWGKIASTPSAVARKFP